jgi:2-polyprenyl-6-methoxyphenol hydroxylase-like FAD-dependent oxidoreductase
LYNNLPDKSKILVNKRVSEVTETAEGVQVHVEDGSTYEGDIVVGCDGVNSTVREFMWANANKAIPGLIPATEKRCKFINENTLDYGRN